MKKKVYEAPFCEESSMEQEVQLLAGSKFETSGENATVTPSNSSYGGNDWRGREFDLDDDE